jgi:gentisate 1,2-dioxygenase
MSRGDLILTPHGTWHDHGNDGREAVIWVDVLNVPLVESLNATRFEFDYTEREPQSNTGEPVKRSTQTIREPDEHSDRLYGAAGLLPLFVSHRRGLTEHSPMFVYRWHTTKHALEQLRDYPGSPYDGIILEYIDPTTGGPVMPTMSFRSQLLRPGERTQAHRKTASTIYCVLDGEGYAEVDGKRLEWARNDVFTVPGWTWHAHGNAGKEDAFLYSVTDEPAMRKLGLFREEGKLPDGGIQVLAA